jgi:cupin fold WbuC family metalloprotein
MKVFGADYFSELIAQAQGNLRKRQHCNIHESYADPCQRLFNAIEPESYIRPHRHATDPRDELLIAVCGSMVLVTFDEQGVVTEIVRFSERRNCENFAVGVQVPTGTWHTVIALESGSVLFEVKAGPFDPKQPKDLASWSPVEGSPAALAYFNKLVDLVETHHSRHASDAETPLDLTARPHRSISF